MNGLSIRLLKLCTLKIKGHRLSEQELEHVPADLSLASLKKKKKVNTEPYLLPVDLVALCMAATSQ